MDDNEQLNKVAYLMRHGKAKIENPDEIDIIIGEAEDILDQQYDAGVPTRIPSFVKDIKKHVKRAKENKKLL